MMYLSLFLNLTSPRYCLKQQDVKSRMNAPITKHYLSKLTHLAVKFSKNEATSVDIIQLQVLLSAFKSYLKTTNQSEEVDEQLSAISKLVA